MTESNASAPAVSGMVTGVAALVAGLVGAVIACMVVNAIGMNIFPMSALEKKVTAMVQQVPSAEQQVVLADEFNKRAAKHCMVWFATAGAILGALVGAGVAVSGKYNKLLVVALPAVLCALAGLAAGPVSISLAQVVKDNRVGLQPSDMNIMLMHGATWAILGAAIGLGVGCAASNRALLIPRLLGAGVFGGILGGAFMHLPGGLLLASTDFSINIPNPEDTVGRMYYFCFPMVFIAFIIGHTAAAGPAAHVPESSSAPDEATA